MNKFDDALYLETYISCAMPEGINLEGYIECYGDKGLKPFDTYVDGERVALVFSDSKEGHLFIPISAILEINRADPFYYRYYIDPEDEYAFFEEGKYGNPNRVTSYGPKFQIRSFNGKRLFWRFFFQWVWRRIRRKFRAISR